MTIISREVGSLKNYPERYDPNAYDYGIIEVTDFENNICTTYKLCIRCGYVEKVKNFAGDSYWEFQMIYRDDHFKTQLLLIDKSKHNHSIRLIHKGQMSVEL